MCLAWSVSYMSVSHNFDVNLLAPSSQLTDGYNQTEILGYGQSTWVRITVQICDSDHSTQEAWEFHQIIVLFLLECPPSNSLICILESKKTYQFDMSQSYFRKSVNDLSLRYFRTILQYNQVQVMTQENFLISVFIRWKCS